MAKQIVTEHVVGAKPPEVLNRTSVMKRLTEIERWCRDHRRGVVSSTEEHLLGICGELSAMLRYTLMRAEPPESK